MTAQGDNLVDYMVIIYHHNSPNITSHHHPFCKFVSHGSVAETPRFAEAMVRFGVLRLVILLC